MWGTLPAFYLWKFVKFSNYPAGFKKFCVSFFRHSKKLGQHQSQWILMKDAALDKDPQSIIFKVFIAVG